MTSAVGEGEWGGGRKGRDWTDFSLRSDKPKMGPGGWRAGGEGGGSGGRGEQTSVRLAKANDI